MEPEQLKNLRMPAEWENQTAIWLSWPHNQETWPENLLAAQHEFVELVRTIAGTQPVFVMAGREPLQVASQRLGSINNVELVEIATNDAWARDYAPTFVVSESHRLVAINWFYNAWGGKYPPFDQDQLVAQRVADYLKIDCVSPGLCFEGGAVEVNAQRVLLSTKSCVLDPNRNPGRSLAEVEHLLGDFLGVREFIWLSGDAIEGDDTDGHIDQLARFVNDQTIVYAWSDHEDDPQQVGLQRHLAELQIQLRDSSISDGELVPLSIPARIEFCGRRVPASYCNFLITNRLVIVPQFGVPEDHLALETLRPFFATREVIGLPSSNLSVGLGSFHCLSQQQPASRSDSN